MTIWTSVVCRSKATWHLYIGGMGAKDKNFFNDYAKALGFEEAAAKIQELYLAGKKEEAMAAVPGRTRRCRASVSARRGRIRERLQAWKEAGKQGRVSSMLIGAGQKEALEVIADEML
ncbi:MAG: hypothetical protein U5O39_16480 [Gammaproteobacteria bacterium]|nr:hypothetical protein [Gammaproteobacteria bacterium]